MSNATQLSTHPGAAGNARLIYILYLTAVVVGMTALIGVIMAYVSRQTDDPILDSHYRNQINIFWKGLLYSLIGLVLSIVGIGIIILIATLVWYIVRSVKGLQSLSKGEAIAAPGSWFF